MSDQERSSPEPALHSKDLEELAEQVKSVVDIQDRKYGIPPRIYAACFVGNEAVLKLVRAEIACDAEEALRIGNLLLQAGVIHHVQHAHAFKNEHLFYRFSSDEDHGQVAQKPEGGGVSWSDFLPAFRSSRSPDSLQPSLPERDPDLAGFARVDLEEIGIAPLDEYNTELLDLTHPREWIDPSPKDNYNLVVLGAGTGGLVSAAAATGVGAQVALIESHLLGGDCLNVGCVPSKALLRCAHVAALARRAAEFGLKIQGEVTVDFAGVMKRMRRLRAAIAHHDSAKRFSRLGADVFIGSGRFTGSNTIEVNGTELKFSKAVIATGGTAAIPPIEGLKEAPYLTNASIFNLTELPPRLGVIGAGPIGLEMAQAFQRFGSQVTVLSRSGEILPKEDWEAARIVEQSMRADGVQFEYQVSYQRVVSQDGEPPITLGIDQQGTSRSLEFDALLVATGRKPAVSGLGLEEAGVNYDERKGIEVNDRLQTSNSSIYAVGDVATKYQFTHVADFMARLVIRNALFFGRDKMSDLLIPWVTYTEPEVAHVGLYEKDLEERNIEYVTFKREFSEVDRAIVEGEVEGFVKIHVKKGTDQILGATIVASHAGDMIGEVSVAMQSEMGLGKLANVIHPYPTVAEAIRQCGDEYNRTRLTPTVKKIFYRLMAMQR